MKPTSYLMVILFLLTACTGCDDKLKPGEFEDPAFKACIEHTIDSLVENELVDRNDPELYNKITKVGCGAGEIKSIKGIENMPNIDWLGITDNQIESLEPLRTLTKLEWLKLDNNKIEELNPLSGLVNMVTLSLSDNYIKEISPLFTMSKLEIIWLDGNCIGDPQQFVELKQHAPNVATGGAENYQEPEKCQ